MRVAFFPLVALTLAAGVLSACGSKQTPPQLTVIAPYKFQVMDITDKRSADASALAFLKYQEATPFDNIRLARALERAINVDLYAYEPAAIKLTVQDYVAVKTDNTFTYSLLVDAVVTRDENTVMAKDTLACREEGKTGFALFDSVKEVTTGDKENGAEQRVWQRLIERCAQRMADRIAIDVANWHSLKLKEMGR